MGLRRPIDGRKDRLVRVPDRGISVSNRRKRYQEVADVIRDRIARGEWQPRSQIPSQVEMAKEFGVSGSTVSDAIAHLRERRYVWTLPHKGSYARPAEHWREEPS
ncbi:winged helix-turn-helix domain-containing protein [Actinoallomurus sp. CA-150999]|uniref:winged helix-turn-helix domain-containing protein n=1 Tax=Actinoallomurus sp. CA-150999 TaxID=3239887 RepID=UPI003D8CB52F